MMSVPTVLLRIIQLVHQDLGKGKRGQDMITIDYKSRQPIYEQIIDKVKELIIAGVLKRDDQLPPVRQLAQELAINPNTIQKAYAELERQGVIYSMKGKVSYVGSSLVELTHAKKAQLTRELEELCAELYAIKVPVDDVCSQIKAIYQQCEEAAK